MRCFERQEIKIPVFDNSSRKYDNDFAHAKRSFSVQTISCVYQKYFCPLRLKKNTIEVFVGDFLLCLWSLEKKGQDNGQEKGRLKFRALTHASFSPFVALRTNTVLWLPPCLTLPAPWFQMTKLYTSQQEKDEPPRKPSTVFRVRVRALFEWQNC